MKLEACSSSEIPECSGQQKAKDVRGRDRISELPEAILGHILSSLPTKNSVRTSTLSKRWRNVWTSVPIIKIDELSLRWEYDQYWQRQSGFNDFKFKDWFMNFVDKVLLPSLSLSYEVSCVRKLHLICPNYYDWSRVSKWIEVVNRLDDLEELDLAFTDGSQRVKLPPRTFTSKKLMILKLTTNTVLNFPSSVCLPRLKKLHLDTVETLDVDSVKKLLTGCPVLEKLEIKRSRPDKMEKNTLYVQSSSLKSFTFWSGNFNFSSRLLKLVIDAPNLKQLDLNVDGKEQVEVHSDLSSLVIVKIDVSNRYRFGPESIGKDVYEINVQELLLKMSNIKYLYLSVEAMESLERREDLDYLPMLKNLMRCEMNMFCCSWPILPCFLESSPKLTSFVLSKIGTRCWFKPHQKARTPKCMMLYLEKIVLHRLRGYEYEIEMVSYFLKNAPVLKKMFLTYEGLNSDEEKSSLRDKVLKLPKASTACEIYVKYYCVESIYFIRNATRD